MYGTNVKQSLHISGILGQMFYHIRGDYYTELLLLPVNINENTPSTYTHLPFQALIVLSIIIISIYQLQCFVSNNKIYCIVQKFCPVAS